MDSVFGWEFPNVIITVVLVGLTMLILNWSQKSRENSTTIPQVSGGLPIIGHAIEFGTNAKEFLEKCRKEYGPAFQFKVLGKSFIILDESFRDAFFSAPPKHLSFMEAIKRTIPVNQIGLANSIKNTWHVPLIKKQFSTRGLPGYMGTIQAQVNRVLREELGDTTEAAIYDNPERLAWICIASCSAVAFMGPDLGQREDILNVFLEYNSVVFKAIEAYSILPGWLMWMVTTDIKKYRTLIRNAVLPEVDRRQKDNDFPHDFLSVMIQNKRSPQDIADRLMAFIFASMVTSAGVLTNVLYDMASPGRGNDVRTRQALVAEQKQVIQKHGTDLTQGALQDMPKLKAFIWETMRTSNPPMQQTRVSIAANVELISNDGANRVTIPRNTLVAMSGIIIESDECVFGKTAASFVADRFLNDQGQLMVEDPSSLGLHSFGIGRHVCPGQHFAMAEIMGSMTTILRQYDMETVSGKVPEYKILPSGRERVVEPMRFVPRRDL